MYVMLCRRKFAPIGSISFEMKGGGVRVFYLVAYVGLVW